MRQIRFIVLAASVMLSSSSYAQSIVLHERDAVVWSQDQVVRGATDGMPMTLYVNGEMVVSASGSFQIPVRLGEGENVIAACSGDGTTCPDTVRWTLGYRLQPEVFASATVEGQAVTLRAQLLEKPNGSVVSYFWEADDSNPAAVGLATPTDSVTSFTMPGPAPHGEYYFNVVVADAVNRAGRARTYVTVDSTGVTPFDIRRDNAGWIDRAVIYEVTPYIFHENGRWRDVTARLPEIAALGVNTLWIQPVFRTHGRGQGYDVTDYFQTRDDLGTPEDLRELVATARQTYGMRVLFDFVPNHTSIRHPYAQDAIANGEASHYYDFYQREFDGVPYSQHYNRRTVGQMDFVYYFWNDLVNLNYEHPEVRRSMVEAGRKWIEEYDIDGYRIDAVWGTNARHPEAMQEWRFELKRLKPEIFLLGEDKATSPSSFDNRFDAAFDWYPETGWVSHWTWETDFTAFQGSCRAEYKTIFNSGPERERARMLRDALTNRGNGWHPDAKVLRFMENNDTFRFLPGHGIKRTRMAAALLFSLPGIPMLYNGQEIGFDCHPYATRRIFRQGSTIRSQDAFGLVPYLERLISLRTEWRALTSDHFEEVPVTPALVNGHTYAYRRWSGDEQIVTTINMAAQDATATLNLPVDALDVDPSQPYYLTDLVTGEYFEATGAELSAVRILIPGYSTRILALADHPIGVPTTSESSSGEMPEAISLEQNYPNPFNPSTTIRFSLPEPGRAQILVFDLLGREVARIMDASLRAGNHEVEFDAAGLASGVYLYQLRFDDRTLTRRMLMIK